MQEPIIDQSPDILSGMPVFYGTRVPIHTLMDYLVHGETIDEFLDDFPTVPRELVLRFLESAERVLVAHQHESST